MVAKGGRELMWSRIDCCPFYSQQFLDFLQQSWFGNFKLIPVLAHRYDGVAYESHNVISTGKSNNLLILFKI